MTAPGGDSEVRNLARDARTVTTDIGEMIETIQDATSDIISSMVVEQSEVKDGVDLINEAGNAILKMYDGASRIVKVVDELSTATLR